MKATVATENLKRALSLAGRATNNRTTLDILENVKVDVDAGGMTLSATNLMIGIVCRIPALEVSSPGQFTVPYKTTSDLIDTLPNEQVVLELIEKTQAMRVKGSGVRTDIKGLGVADFPPISDEWQVEIPLPSEALRDALRKVAACAAPDEPRPVLAGVHLVLQENTLRAEAADGFRWAAVTVELAEPVSESLSVIIPSKTVVEVLKVAELCDTIRVAFSPGKKAIAFLSETEDVVSQAIEGEYPHLDTLMPTAFNTRATLPTKALLTAVKQADVLARAGVHKIQVDLRPGVGEEPGGVRVSGEGQEIGDFESEIEAVVEGQGVSFGANALFVKDALERVDQPQVTVEANADVLPFILRGSGDNRAFWMITPMHLGGEEDHAADAETD